MGNIVYFPGDLIPEDLRSKHFGRKPLYMTQVLMLSLSSPASAKLSWSFAVLLEGHRLLVEGASPFATCCNSREAEPQRS